MVKTKNRGGSILRKGFTVLTNDPSKRQVRLKISGKIKGYVKVDPGHVRLSGPIGQPIKREIKILPLDGHSMTIKKVQAQKGEFLRFELQPLTKDPGRKEYRLVVENTRDEPGNYHDIIIIKTDSLKKPTLRIPVYGRIFDPQPQSKPRQRPSGTPEK